MLGRESSRVLATGCCLENDKIQAFDVGYASAATGRPNFPVSRVPFEHLSHSSIFRFATLPRRFVCKGQLIPLTSGSFGTGSD